MALPPPPPDAASHVPTPPPSRTPARRWVAVAVGAALIGGLGGAAWASAQSTDYQATARASFVDRVDIGAVDAERARILADLGDGLTEAVVEVDDSAAVEVDTPSGRNFIDVIVSGPEPDQLVAAATAGADALVAAESDNLVARLVADAEAERDASDALEPQIAELEAEMAVQLELEAAADVLRSDEDAGVREQAFVDARNANDAYWKAARQRNALVDQQNEFIRAAERLDAEARTAASLEVTSVTDAERDATPSMALGALGGAALGLAVVALVTAALAPRRD